MTPRWMPVAAWAAVAAGAAAVGLTSVGAVRDVVADEPVEVLSAADVNRILAEPDAQLDPIPTLAAAPSVPREPATAGPAQVTAGVQTQLGTRTTRSRGAVTNADDRPSKVDGDPRPLSDSTGGQLGANGTGEGVPVETAGPSPSPSGSPSADPSGSPTASPSPSPSTTPSTDPSPSATPSPEPTSSPSGTPTTPAPSPSATPAPSPSPTATADPSASSTPVPSGSATPDPTVLAVPPSAISSATAP